MLAEPLETVLPMPDGTEAPFRVRLLSALELAKAMGRGRVAAKAAAGGIEVRPGDALHDLFVQAEVLAATAERGTLDEGGAVTWARAWKSGTEALEAVDADRIAYLHQQYEHHRGTCSPFITELTGENFTKLLVEAGVAKEGDPTPPFWKELAPDLQWSFTRTLASAHISSLTTN